MKLRTCSKITWPHLGYESGEYYFTFRLDFFASFFYQEKNDEPKRLERESKQILFILFQSSNSAMFTAITGFRKLAFQAIRDFLRPGGVNTQVKDFTVPFNINKTIY